MNAECVEEGRWIVVRSSGGKDVQGGRLGGGEGGWGMGREVGKGRIARARGWGEYSGGVWWNAKRDGFWWRGEAEARGGASGRGKGGERASIDNGGEIGWSPFLGTGGVFRKRRIAARPGTAESLPKRGGVKRLFKTADNPEERFARKIERNLNLLRKETKLEGVRILECF